MKKLFLVVAIAALAFSACTRDTSIDNPQEMAALASFTTRSDAVEGYIPIATLGQKGEIELLFLQKDVQAAFSKENPDQQLVFVEVRDDGKELGLLYRIYNKATKATATSICYAVILKEGVYYAPSTSLLRKGSVMDSRTVTCKTTECSQDPVGCIPKETTCTRCSNYRTCEKTVTSDITDELTHIIRAIE